MVFAPGFQSLYIWQEENAMNGDGNGVVKGPTSQQSAISGYAFCNKDFRMLGQQY
jgi:hypothetical protein